MIQAVFGLEPLFLCAVVVVGFVGFVFSSVLGVGGALLLIPVLTTAMRPIEAVAITTPVMLVNNALKTWVFRRHVDRRALLLLSAGALPAAAVASTFAARVDERVILLGVAAVIVASLAATYLLATPVRLSDRALALFSVFTGTVSGLCGAAGPSTAVGLSGYGLDRERFVGTVAVYAVLLQLVKLPGYVATGAMPLARWPLALLLSAVALVAVLWAPRVVARMQGRAFRIALDGFLAITAVAMVFDALSP